VEPAPRRRGAFLAGRGRSRRRPAMSDERVRKRTSRRAGHGHRDRGPQGPKHTGPGL
jgi:hypothetical protein